MNEKYITLSDKEIAEIENKINYCFCDKRLISKAFTHSSFVNENKDAVSNERLEFLGDRIINFICAEKLFFNEGGDEGRLTELLINKVSKEPLSLTVKNLDIFKYLKISKGASFLSENPKAESDLYEALLAAIYVDSGNNLKLCAEFVEKTLVDIEIIDYISLFKIYCEKNPEVKITETPSQNSKNGRFEHKITLSDKVFSGEGANKDEAKKNASKKACEFLKILQG